MLTMIIRLYAVFLFVFFFSVINTAAQDRQEIDQLLQQVSSDSYRVRERATSELAKLKCKDLQQILFYIEKSQLAEVELRLFQVVTSILDNAGVDEINDAAEALNKAKESSSKRVRDFAQRFEYLMGSAETEKIADTFRKLVSQGREKVTPQDPNAEIISKDYAKELINAKDFKLVKVARHSPESKMRLSNDASKHQKILIYRVKWFNGGWSRWFVPGVNDADAKFKGELMWRYFQDHDSQYIELRPKFGPFSRRQTFTSEGEEEK